MSTVTSSAAKRSLPARNGRERSRKTGTLAAWRTDRNLKILGMTYWPGLALRTRPAVGQVVSRRRRRSGFLEPAAHLDALRGKPVRYHFSLLRRVYEVRLVPRRDRRGRILGVRGILRSLPNGGDVRLPLEQQNGVNDVIAKALKESKKRRRRSSAGAALRSLQLAKAVAETARMNADLRNERAAAQQQKALQAQLRAEEEERRARFLADSSAILDTSFDLTDTIKRVGKLLTLRMADWCVLYFREGNLLRRFMLHGRDEKNGETLNEIFPGGEESGFFESGFFDAVNRGRWELFPTLTPEDVADLLPRGPRRRAFRQLGTHWLILVPIIGHGRLIGLPFMGSFDPGRLWLLQELQLARDLAAGIGLARDSSTVYPWTQMDSALPTEA